MRRRYENQLASSINRQFVRNESMTIYGARDRHQLDRERGDSHK